jgi:hypothetical protein
VRQWNDVRRLLDRSWIREMAVLLGLVTWTGFMFLLPISGHTKFAFLMFPFLIILVARFMNVTLYLFIAMVPITIVVFSGDLQVGIPLIVLLVFAMGLVSGHWKIEPTLFAIAATFALFLIISIQSNEGPVQGVSAYRDLLTLLLGLGLCVVATSVKPSITLILVSIGASSVIVATVIITRAYGQVSLSVDPLNGLTFGQSSALGLNPNYLGLILALGVVAIAGLSTYYHNPLLLLATVPIWIALTETKSRGSIVAVVVGLFFIYIVGRGLRARIIIIWGICLALILWPGIVGYISRVFLEGRLHQNLSYETDARIYLARLAVQLSLQHPLFGIGYGNFPFRAVQSPSVGLLLVPHDDFLRIAAEVGLPALILLVTIFFKGVRSMRQINSGNAAVAVTMTYLVGMITIDSLSSLPLTAGVWVLIGSSIGLARSKPQMKTIESSNIRKDILLS